MKAWSTMTWRIDNCATNSLQWPDGVRDMWLAPPATLIVNTFRVLTFLDVSDPLQARVIHQRPSSVGRTVRTRLCGTRLVCCGDDGVEILDVSRPDAPASIALLTTKQIGHAIFSGAFVGDTLYVPRGLGVETLDLASGALTAAGTAKDVDATDAYSGDIIASDAWVVTSCHDHGVQVFAREGDGTLRHAKGFKSGTTNLHLTWDGADAFVDVGESDSLTRFTLAGGKPAKQKNWKPTGVMLASQVVRRGDEIVACAIKARDDDASLVVLVANTSGAAPTSVQKIVVPGFIARDQCADAMRGLVAIGDVLLVGSYSRRVYAVTGT
jgi:hypothetical protein